MPHKVLVVEDEGIVALDIEQALKKFGYEVTSVVDSGEDAILAAAKDRPDLVLMDIMLRGEMDGIEAAAHIRDRYDIPVVYLTAHADESTLQRARVTTPYGYILKPFDELDLKPTIELALDRSKREMNIKRANGSPALFDRVGGRSELKNTQSVSAAFKSIEPLSSFSPSVCESLARCSQLTTLEEGECLAYEGDRGVSAFIVLWGRVVLIKSSPSGKELIVDFIPPGDFFPLSLVLEEDDFPFTAKAHIQSKVLIVPRTALRLALEEHLEIYQLLSQQMAHRLRDSFDLSRRLAHDRAEVRIAAALLSLRDRLHIAEPRKKEEFVLELTRKEVADLTGTTPETASRVSKALERDGIIDLHQAGVVIVKRPDALEMILEE